MLLTQHASSGETSNVRIGRVLLLIALAAIQPACLFAASYASKRDPVGEKVYASGTLWRMAPVAIMVGGLGAAWLLTRIRRKARQRAVDNIGSHDA